MDRYYPDLWVSTRCSNAASSVCQFSGRCYEVRAAFLLQWRISEQLRACALMITFNAWTCKVLLIFKKMLISQSGMMLKCFLKKAYLHSSRIYLFQMFVLITGTYLQQSYYFSYLYNVLYVEDLTCRSKLFQTVIKLRIRCLEAVHLSRIWTKGGSS